MVDTRQFESTDSSGSSDDAIVAALQRLAHAQAQLFQAENDVTSPGEDAARLGDRNREIEEAHTKLLWTQAQTLNAPRGDRTPKVLEPHRKREQQALAKFGFASFEEYLDDRARRPTNNMNLAKARREYRAAHDHWEEVLAAKTTGSVPGTTAPASAAAAAAPAAMAAPTPAPAAPRAADATAPAPATAVTAVGPPPEGLSPSTRIALAVAAAVVVLLAGFLVLRSRGSSTADAALSTVTLPVTSTAPRSAPVASIPKSVPTTTVAAGRGGPTTAAETPSSTPVTQAPGAPTTTAVDRTEALCAAAKIFSLDDLYGLAERAVANPKAMLQAYESMALTAPANLTPHMQALGPVTREAIKQIQSGHITTAQGLQKWLADEAPKDDLAQWIAAQGVVVPALKEICAGK